MNNKARVIIGLVLVVVVSVAFIGYPGPVQAQAPSKAATSGVKWPEMIGVAARPPGAEATTLAMAVAAIVQKYTSTNCKISHHATTQRAWKMLNDGTLQMTVDNSMEPWAAWFARDPYPEQLSNLRLLCSMTCFSFGMGAAEGKGIKGVQDLKGKALAYVEAIPCYAEYQRNILKGKGLTLKDVSVVPAVNPGQSVQLVMDNRADVAGIVGVVQPIAQQAAEKVGLFLLPIDWKDPRVVEALRGTPPCFPVKIPAQGKGTVVREDTWFGGYDGVVIVNKNEIKEDLAYEMTKLLWEKYDEFRDHSPPVATTCDLQGGRNGFLPKHTMVMPYHEGAIRFLKEKGLWSDYHQKAQQMLLKQPPEILPFPAEMSK